MKSVPGKVDRMLAGLKKTCFVEKRMVAFAFAFTWESIVTVPSPQLESFPDQQHGLWSPWRQLDKQASHT